MQALALEGNAPADGYELADYVFSTFDENRQQDGWLNLSATGRTLPTEPLHDVLHETVRTATASRLIRHARD